MEQNIFRDDVKKRRKSLKLSQEDVAKAMGISRGKVQRIESGNGTVGEINEYLKEIKMNHFIMPTEYLTI